MVEDVSCLPDFQVKNYACSSQGTYADRSCTQHLSNNLMSNDVIKKGNEDIKQDVPDNICDMLVTKFPTQRKDEQFGLVIS